MRKSPVITDGDRVVYESGAIIDYIVRRHGDGRLAPAMGGDGYEIYNQWMHYAEGTVMGAMLLALSVQRSSTADPALQARVKAQLANQLGYLDAT